MKPKWRDVVGYEGSYWVSDSGEVMSVKTGKILKPFWHTKGYEKVQLEGREMYVHRIVAEAFLDNPRGLPQVNHKNCNKRDNRVKNLEWCSNDYNIGYANAIRRMRRATQ